MPFVFFVLVAAGCVAATASARADDGFLISAAPIAPAQAPVDVYFGPYRLSNLSVRNAIHDMTIEGDSPLALPGQVQRIAAVQSALTQWALAYPRDPWVPGTMRAFAEFLLGKNLPQYDRIAYALLDELTLRYPATADGRAARSDLAALTLLPQFDLADGPAVRPMPLVFESVLARIGENRRYHLF